MWITDYIITSLSQFIIITLYHYYAEYKEKNHKAEG